MQLHYYGPEILLPERVKHAVSHLGSGSITRNFLTQMGIVESKIMTVIDIKGIL